MAYRNAVSIVAVAALLSACGDSTLDYRNAEISNGKVFEKGENKPFSGDLTNFPQSLIRRSNDLVGILSGLVGTLDELKRTDESIRTLELVCNGGLKDGFLNGEVSCYEPGTSTLRYQAHYKSGLMDGGFTVWGRHDNVLTKASFKDDRTDGQFQQFSPNTGKLIQQVDFRAGVIDGLNQRWDEKTGQLTYRAKAEKGFYVGTIEAWSPDGRKTAEVPYENGQINGVVRAWDPTTGQLIKEAHYRDGLPDGTTNEWYEDGRLRSSGEYRDNVYYSVPTSTDDSKNDSCVADYAKQFHAEAGEDAPVNSEQLGEWEKWCEQGRPST
ncbi:toxin-antitoxin system YwqK family antitoxin [Pseudomonas typographi]|uniref:Lipoprotein n=1 Tax=Pseudomonas typographi TaxID=2715964 RepID=A0ABR7Z303_9PSED|nr:hypothetical protein [Pseudomonas typographi]MBD1599865.1 hypothetical protein [Pseudomonas typographi]